MKSNVTSSGQLHYYTHRFADRGMQIAHRADRQHSGGNTSKRRRGSAGAPQTAAQVQNAVIPHGDSSPQPGLSRTETILVVEDHEELRRYIVECLRRDGYNVLVASSAAESLSALESHKSDIDLLLTDVALPGVSGRELARRASLRGRPMKVLYLSGQPEDLIWARSFRDATVHYLSTPFTPRILAEAVASALGTRRVVLVVDHDAAERAALLEALGAQGCEVLEAGDWKLAGDLLRAHRVDLIIGDLAGIGAADRERVRELRRVHRGAGFIALVETPGRFPAPALAALKARWRFSADATLKKPVPLEPLVGIVKKILDY
jgi:CheY-like chemotaxis protein